MTLPWRAFVGLWATAALATIVTSAFFFAPARGAEKRRSAIALSLAAALPSSLCAGEAVLRAFSDRLFSRFYLSPLLLGGTCLGLLLLAASYLESPAHESGASGNVMRAIHLATWTLGACMALVLVATHVLLAR